MWLRADLFCGTFRINCDMKFTTIAKWLLYNEHQMNNFKKEIVRNLNIVYGSKNGVQGNNGELYL